MQGNTRVCEDVRTIRRDRDRLKVTYKEHLAVKGAKRLAWMERQLDMYAEQLRAAQDRQSAEHPAGCLGCGMYGACPYAE